MAKFRAALSNHQGVHEVFLQANKQSHTIKIPPKEDGYGSSISGGELLFLALATCYCNDIYREAAKRGIKVERVDVDVEGEFEHEGAPAKNITYSAWIKADASEEEILKLLDYTDHVAEIHNTLRTISPVSLRSWGIIE